MQKQKCEDRIQKDENRMLNEGLGGGYIHNEETKQQLRDADGCKREEAPHKSE
ncbi:hypothetical protein B0H94_107181 [Salsuginibacillus halophilus]|uniref:Uncharacterized protein n=1 Tax=Salsuginibacillus halophilus TaxID=517424 RepID=A0A2P8HG55_9BACI|nr:hypothetical protein [Salsuginibacillus halophilus]PSL45176.1 hypothetical protein B0H94_107181 [Salsuginibacillus halophilus]